MYPRFIIILIAVSRRSFASQAGYESTVMNLRINKDTKVICQGFTGRQVTFIFETRQEKRRRRLKKQEGPI